MKSPITGSEMILQKEKRTLSFRKEEFEVEYHYYLCTDSKEQFEDDQLADLNVTQVYNQYRERLKLPFPDEIDQQLFQIDSHRNQSMRNLRPGRQK